MEGHAQKYIVRFCELAHKTADQLHQVSSLCVDDHQFKEIRRLKGGARPLGSRV